VAQPYTLLLQVNGAMPEEDAVVVVRDILTVLAECNRQKVPSFADQVRLSQSSSQTVWPSTRGGKCRAPSMILLTLILTPTPTLTLESSASSMQKVHRVCIRQAA